MHGGRTAAPEFPEDIERWWLRHAARVVGDRATEPERWKALEAALARLCEGFTSDRAKGLGGYADRAEALAAYGLFYFPQSFARIRQLLAEADARRPAAEYAVPRRILDLGAGVGAAACAAAAHFAETAPDTGIEITAVDRAPAGLALLRELFAELAPARWPRARLHTRAGDAADPAAQGAGPWDMALASLTLNEIFEGRPDADLREWTRGVLARLTPGGRLVICEPGTPAAARRLQRLRDAIAADGSATILAPCPHHGPCPLLAAPDAWCHDVRRWSAPPAARRINRRLFLPVDRLRYSLLILENAPRPAAAVGGAPRPARLVAPPFSTAGRIVFRGCAANGAIETYEALTRGLSRARKEALAGWERGERIDEPIERRLGDGRWRLNVRPMTEIPGAPADSAVS